MKKLIIIFLLVLVFGLYGCSHERNNPFDPNGTNYQETNK
jgi:hypothetical protein